MNDFNVIPVPKAPFNISETKIVVYVVLIWLFSLLSAMSAVRLLIREIQN